MEKARDGEGEVTEPEASASVVPVVLLVGGRPSTAAVRAALAGLGLTARVRELQDGLDDALGDPTLNVAVVDLGEGRAEVLRRFQHERPDVPVVGLARDGSIASAVSAMHQGAADVIEWPGAEADLRAAVERQLSCDPSRVAREYSERVGTARRQILDRAFEVATAQLKRAVALDVRRPDAFNLFGVLDEVRGKRIKAQGWWRMALLVNPAYQPAKDNLTRSTRRPAPPGPLSLG